MNEYKLVHFFSWWTKKIREHSKNAFTFLDKLNICKNENMYLLQGSVQFKGFLKAID